MTQKKKIFNQASRSRTVGKNESANSETTHFLHNYVVSPNTYLNSTSSSHDTFKETLMKKNPSEIYHSGVVHHFSEWLKTAEQV